MKIKIWAIAIMLALATFARGATNDLTGLLQQGLFEEEANRNLDAAIADYQSLATAFDKDRQLAATAIFRLGECYRKLGKTNEAVIQYQRIVKEFSDQPTLVTLSRQNLTGLNVTSAPAVYRENESAIFQVEEDIAQLQAQITTLEQLNRDQDQATIFVQQNYPNPVLTELVQELDLAEQQLIKLKLDYNADHPKYLSAKEMIDDLRAKIEAQVDGVLTGLRGKLASEQTLLRLEQNREGEVAGNSGGLMLKPQDSAATQQLRQQIEAVNQQLVEKESGLQQLLKTYLPSNPQVVGVQRMIDAENAKLKELTAQFQSLQAPNTTSEAAPTDEEQQEIRRIQAMIQNSPDLINAAGGGVNGNLTPLMLAAWKGQLVVAKYLLDHGADVNGTSQNSQTPLSLAADNGHKAMVELLLSRGADPNGAQGPNPLYQAVSRGFTGVVDVLLANKADPNARTGDNGKRPLHAASWKGDTNLVQLLIDHGADVNAADLSSNTPLHLAASQNHPEIARILIDDKANVDARDNQGNTPLHLASEAGSEKIASMLLDSGASVDAINHHLGTPLIFACYSGHDDVVRTLLAHKANPNLSSRPDSNGNAPSPPVAWTVGRRRTAILQMLLEAGANPNGDTNQWYPIFSALGDNGAPDLKLLLEHGANPNVKDSEGLTPLFLTSTPELVRLLIDYKADLNARDRFGETAIMRVISDMRITGEAATNFTKILLDAGAKTDLQDTNGNTALHFAVYYSRPESVALLLEHNANPNIQNDNGYTSLDIAKQGMTGQVLRNWLNPNSAAEIRGTIPGTYSKMAELLTTAGGLANLPKRDRIEVRRAVDRPFIIMKDPQDRNRYSLLEAIASAYGFISQRTIMAGRNPAMGRVGGLGREFQFPDFKKIVIYRRIENSAKQTVMKVNVEDILNSGDCSRDIWLEWGDIVEIPEADHPVDENWQGIPEKLAAPLIKCYSRSVTIKIKGDSTTLQLPTSSASAENGFMRPVGGSSSCMLRSVLYESRMIRVSSDLSRVKVTRTDPVTKKTAEWTADCTSPEEGPDLWLRDGDVIEVPEK